MADGPRIFSELVDAYQAEIMRYLVRLTGHRDDADDLFQETCLRGFRAFGRLRRNSNHRAWLYRIATNVYLNHRRRVRRRAETALGDDFEAWFPADSAVSDLAPARLALTRAIRSLSRRQRSAFLQRKLQGRSYAEIGETLGCTATTARAHVYQAATRIRRDLGGRRTG